MVRLRDWEIDGIKKSILDSIPEAEVFLYGSRVDDSKKGGDIDLLVYVSEIPEYDLQSKIKLAMYDAIGEQKIDILYTTSDEDSSFVKMIQDQKVKL